MDAFHPLVDDLEFVSQSLISWCECCTCRVDYFQSQTTFDSNLLSVISLPSPPSILTPGGDRISANSSDAWIPVGEDSSLELECESEGGYPAPRLTWWLDSVLLDDTFDRWI